MCCLSHTSLPGEPQTVKRHKSGGRDVKLYVASCVTYNVAEKHLGGTCLVSPTQHECEMWDKLCQRTFCVSVENAKMGGFALESKDKQINCQRQSGYVTQDDNSYWFKKNTLEYQALHQFTAGSRTPMSCQSWGMFDQTNFTILVRAGC